MRPTRSGSYPCASPAYRGRAYMYIVRNQTILDLSFISSSLRQQHWVSMVGVDNNYRCYHPGCNRTFEYKGSAVRHSNDKHGKLDLLAHDGSGLRSQVIELGATLRQAIQRPVIRVQPPRNRARQPDSKPTRKRFSRSSPSVSPLIDQI